MSRREVDLTTHSVPSAVPDTAAELFAGPGPSRAALRAVDWGATQLGEVATWPTDLICAARTVVAAPAPMALWWGQDCYQLHNDAMLAAFGDEAAAVGRPAKQCWPERWDVLGPFVELVLAEGTARQVDEVAVPAAPHGVARLSVAFGPLAEGAQLGGVLACATDVTARVEAGERSESTHAEAVANLQAALASNRRIGTAIGILMAHHRVTEEAAFELLRVASQSAHRKLREIADDVLLTGTLPGRP